jgi:Uma2 family endonuclease
MSLAQALLSREAYLQQEQQTGLKYEFLNGQIYAMAGGTFNHARISGNLFASLRQHLRTKPCQPMNSDLRVHTPSGLDTYPDVSVYCYTPELSDNQTTLLNPILLVEVLSPSTRNYDRSSKFAHYRSIVSLQDYVLIDPESVLIEHYHRLKQDEWLLRVYSQLSDVLNLVTLDIHIPLSELYA